MDSKTLHIIKTLSRTKRKDYENYVINAIYNRVGDTSIKPVTQQYVYNSIKKEHYFIDLYFPQLNIGIEIDERHHIHQTKQDTNRTESIWFEINKIVNDEMIGYNEKRIVVHGKTFDEIELQIDEAVDHIKQTINTTVVVPWVVDLEEFVSKNKVLSLGDDIVFESITQTCNLLFKTSYVPNGGRRKSYFLPGVLNNDNRFNLSKLWFPKLAIENEGIFHAVSDDWNNRLNIDGSIIEYSEREADVVDKDYEEEITWFEHDRFVFAKSKDPLGRVGYKFIGKYKKIKKIALKHGNQYIKAEYYERISKEVPIVKNSENT